MTCQEDCIEREKGWKWNSGDLPTFREREKDGRRNLSRGEGHEEEHVERGDDTSCYDKILIQR